ncbi:hypothetical protein [uncultured Oscillibacter sp.]|uniref:hypothetical protein n=1 Tax=uncultured Oscillibacter sp. TaxID=876091 RepID=UPI00262CEEA3|nr:hypothetical protein [uncultured Oscillibacter sp.]
MEQGIVFRVSCLRFTIGRGIILGDVPIIRVGILCGQFPGVTVNAAARKNGIRVLTPIFGCASLLAGGCAVSIDIIRRDIPAVLLPNTGIAAGEGIIASGELGRPGLRGSFGLHPASISYDTGLLGQFLIFRNGYSFLSRHL